MEMVGSYIFFTNLGLEDPRTLFYSMITSIEETLEMVGMALFPLRVIIFSCRKNGLHLNLF